MLPTSEDASSLFLELPTDMALIESQIDRWWRASEAHEQWAKVATTCTEFLEGNQFTEQEKRILREEGRPEVIKNKIAPLMRIMLGYQRQNRYEINFMPGNDGSGSDDTADLLNSVSAQIDEQNQSDWIDSQVFQDGLTTARGFLDSRLSFHNNRMGNVTEICKDPFTIYIDPEADDYNPNNPRSGWNYFMENRWMSPEDIYLMYGNDAFDAVWNNATSNGISSIDRFDTDTHNSSPARFFGLDHFMSDSFHNRGGMYSSPWQHINKNRKLVRVLDSQHRLLKRTKYFVDLETGDEKVIPDQMPREAMHRIDQWARSRNVPIRLMDGLKKQVRWTVTAGDRVLWDEWSPYGDMMTIVPFFPYFRRGKTRGMLEDLLDPQREINKRASAMLHIIMTTANSGWIFEDGSLDKEMEEALRDEGSTPGINVKYREGYNAPSRIQPANAPTSVERLEDRGNADLKEISGINDSALGNADNAKSGRAIQARQRQTIVGAETYFDNFARTRELKGRLRLYLVQNFYTEPRIIRTRAGQGSAENIVLNARDAAGNITNNIGLGRYDIAIEEAPVSATFLQGQFQEALELLEKGIPIPPDILVDLSSMPNKEEIKQRLIEERNVNINGAQLNNLGQRGQMGIPPDAPLPPIVVPESPTVSVPANAAPMPAPPAGMQPPAPQLGAPVQQPDPNERQSGQPPVGPSI